MRMHKIDGIELADKIKKNMLSIFFKQVDELRRSKSHQAGQS